MKSKFSVAEPVSAYDAKTHLPSLIARTEKGERFVITRHGHPVAQLIPIEPEDLGTLNASVKNIAKLRQHLAAKGVNLGSLQGEFDSIQQMTHDGHRY
jgi:prevent-host-death family protein